MQYNHKGLVSLKPLLSTSFLPHKQVLAKSLDWAFWFSFLSNFVPLGDWRVKLILYVINLMALLTILLTSLIVFYIPGNQVDQNTPE